APPPAPAPAGSFPCTAGTPGSPVVAHRATCSPHAAQPPRAETGPAAAPAPPPRPPRFIARPPPPYSTSIHGGQPELREMWTPIFERYGVDAVFSGHDHVYERSEKNGIRYFVSGGGGAPLYPRDPRAHSEDVAASRFFERTLN